MSQFYKTCIILLALVISSQSLAQKKLVLHFKDGTQQTGYVTFKKKGIQYQENLKSKKTKIEYALLDSASTVINPRAKRAQKPNTLFILPTEKEGKDYRVYDVVKRGKLSLYKYTSHSGAAGLWTPTGGGVGNSVYIPTGGSKSTITYGLKRDDEACVTILYKFVNNGTKYFKDCPSLSENIKNKEKGFKKGDLKKIVDYYNAQCADN